MYDHADELEMTFISKDWDDYNFYNPVFTTPHLTAQEARNLHYEAMTRLIACVPEKIAQKRGQRVDLILGSHVGAAPPILKENSYECTAIREQKFAPWDQGAY